MGRTGLHGHQIKRARESNETTEIQILRPSPARYAYVVTAPRVAPVMVAHAVIAGLSRLSLSLVY